MNKMRFHIAALLLPMLALLAGSCTDEYEYSGAKAEGEQVYFSNELESTLELSTKTNTIDIPIKRIETNGELTVPLTVSIPSGTDYTMPAEVTFADSSANAVIKLSYDPSKIEFGKYDTITVAVADAQYTTPYGASSYTFAVGLSEWKDIDANNSKGVFCDGIISNLYGTDVMKYDVKIQESAVTEGMYRIVSPYGEGTDFYSDYVNGSDFKWAAGKNTDIVIDATDPDFVYVTGDFYTGTDDGGKSPDGGALHVFSYVDYYLANGNSLNVVKEKKPEIFGKLKDGVITFPSNSLVANFDNTLEPAYYANSDRLAVALPGNVLTDYTSSFEYTGRLTDAKGDDYALGTITLGEDVASAKYAVAGPDADLEAFVSGIKDGSIEATEINASGDVKVQLNETGKYNMVVLTYDAAGAYRSASTSEFAFKSSKDAGSTANWQPVYSGTFTYNAKPAFIEDKDGNLTGSIYNGSQEAVIYKDAANPGTYKVAPWANSEDGLVFTMASDGTITFIDVPTGDSSSSYGAIYAADANTKETGIGQATSYYDSEKKQFVFGTLYYVSAGYLGGAYETFDITGSSSAAKAKAKALKAGSHKRKAKRNSGIAKPIFKKAYVSRQLR